MQPLRHHLMSHKRQRHHLIKKRKDHLFITNTIDGYICRFIAFLSANMIKDTKMIDAGAHPSDEHYSDDIIEDLTPAALFYPFFVLGARLVSKANTFLFIYEKVSVDRFDHIIISTRHRLCVWVILIAFLISLLCRPITKSKLRASWWRLRVRCAHSNVLQMTVEIDASFKMSLLLLATYTPGRQYLSALICIRQVPVPFL